MKFTEMRGINEKNVPTKQDSKKAKTWLPIKDGNTNWKGNNITQTPERPSHHSHLKNTFGKDLRLTKRSQFISLRGKCYRFSGEVCRIQYELSPLSSEAPPKLGITVSKKYGHAIKRNLFKRWIREVFRQTQLNFPRGLTFNVAPHFWVKEINHQRIHQDFESFLKAVEKLIHSKSSEKKVPQYTHASQSRSNSSS